MEELFSILFLLIVGAISIISKIVSAQKKQNEVTVIPRGTPSQRPATPVRPTPKPVAVPAQVRSPVAIANKKSLIPEEEEDTDTEKNISSSKTEDAEDMTIKATEIGSVTNTFADDLKANRQFAIICHEILGKPKALEQK